MNIHKIAPCLSSVTYLPKTSELLHLWINSEPVYLLPNDRMTITHSICWSHNMLLKKHIHKIAPHEIVYWRYYQKNNVLEWCYTAFGAGFGAKMKFGRQIWGGAKKIKTVRNAPIIFKIAPYFYMGYFFPNFSKYCTTIWRGCVCSLRNNILVHFNFSQECQKSSVRM